MIAGPLLLLGQFLGIGLACGLNLYVTVAVLGLGSRFGWIAPLPAGLHGLQHGLVLGSATLLFLIEFVVDKRPHLDSLWDAIHTVIRPIAAALLALAALGALPREIQLAGAVLAGAVSLAAHGAKAGLRLAIHAGPGSRAGPVLSLAEDIGAIALVVTAMRFPTAIPAIAAGAIALLALLGPRLWRAFLLGMRALGAWFRGFFGEARWREPAEMPAALRALIAPHALGAAPPRATRAAIRGARGAGNYRNGWLVFTAAGPVFLYRSLFGPRSMPIPAAPSARLRKGPWIDALELQADGFRGTLFLLKDGPPAEVVINDLAPVD